MPWQAPKPTAALAARATMLTWVSWVKAQLGFGPPPGPPPADRLVAACASGDLPSALAAVAAGASVNGEGTGRDGDVWLPLESAVIHRHCAVVVWLLSQGAHTSGETTVMFYAAVCSAPDILQLVIDAGGDVSGLLLLYATREDNVRLLLAQPSLDLAVTQHEHVAERFAQDPGRPWIADLMSREVSTPTPRECPCDSLTTAKKKKRWPYLTTKTNQAFEPLSISCLVCCVSSFPPFVFLDFLTRSRWCFRYLRGIDSKICCASSDRETRGTGTLAGLRAPSFASPGGRDFLRPLCLLVCASQQSRPHASWMQLTRPAWPDWCGFMYRRWVLRMRCCTAMICTVRFLLPGRHGSGRTACAGGEGLRQQLRMPCTRAWNCVHHCCDNDWSPCFHLPAGATAQRASVLLDYCGDSITRLPVLYCAAVVVNAQNHFSSRRGNG